MISTFIHTSKILLNKWEWQFQYFLVLEPKKKVNLAQKTGDIIPMVEMKFIWGNLLWVLRTNCLIFILWFNLKVMYCKYVISLLFTIIYWGTSMCQTVIGMCTCFIITVFYFSVLFILVFYYLWVSIPILSFLTKDVFLIFVLWLSFKIFL